MSGEKFWLDGICNNCGGIVIECGADKRVCADYMNTCTNPKCKNHAWHFVGDQDEPEYYKHGFEESNIPIFSDDLEQTAPEETFKKITDFTLLRDGLEEARQLVKDAIMEQVYSVMIEEAQRLVGELPTTNKG